MIHINDPNQPELFDSYEHFLSKVAYKRLKSSYYAVFRYIILTLMPAKELGEHFHEEIGRPTKELYSMAGLLLLKEFKNWTTEEAADAYMFDSRIQYALNLGRDKISFCERTLERYMKLLREDELAAKIFDDVTARLIEELDLQIDKQRLDSTHVFSDMATFSRTKLMGVAIKRFLVQLKRHHKDNYMELPASLRTRYEKKENALFADVSKDKEKRSNLRQDVAEQLYELIQYFSGDDSVEKMSSFKNLITIFDQQCEVKDSIDVSSGNSDDDDQNNAGNNSDTDSPEDSTDTEITVRKKTGGNIIQNPSDLEATYCGHKGPGYQVQITETSNKDNEVQLVTSVLPQTAVESDANAVKAVLDDLERTGRLPEKMLADTLYGSDENVVDAAQRGVDVISPVPGPPPKKEPDKPSDKHKRLQQRREIQETEQWREEYNSRAQLEGTIGSVKRRTGMVRLRYRGEKSMYSALYLKLAGWNISRALCSARIQRKLAEIIPKMAGSPKNRLSNRLSRLQFVWIASSAAA